MCRELEHVWQCGDLASVPGWWPWASWEYAVSGKQRGWPPAALGYVSQFSRDAIVYYFVGRECVLLFLGFFRSMFIKHLQGFEVLRVGNLQLDSHW